MKKFLISVVILSLFSTSIFAARATAKFQSESYTLNITYNDTITPGNAIFARMTVTIPKNHKKTKTDSERNRPTCCIDVIPDSQAIIHLSKTTGWGYSELGNMPISELSYWCSQAITYSINNSNALEEQCSNLT